MFQLKGGYSFYRFPSTHFRQVCQVSEVSCRLNSKYELLTRCGHTGAWGILLSNVLQATLLRHSFSLPLLLCSFLCLKYQKLVWSNIWACQWLGECADLEAFRLVCACVRHVCVCTWGSASLISVWFDKTRPAVWRRSGLTSPKDAVSCLWPLCWLLFDEVFTKTT